jgi:hypothetical protein
LNSLSDLQLIQVVAASAFAAAGILVGAAVASRVAASAAWLSACVGGTVGIVAGTICFEMLPALRGAGGIPLVVGALVVGFGLAGMVHRLVGARLPLKRSFEEEEFSAFIVGTTTEDITEGVVLGLAGGVSWGLFLFCVAAFFAMNVLQGFSQGSVLRWWKRRPGQILAVGAISSAMLVTTACLTVWLFRNGSADPAVRDGLFALATGALIYVSVFEFGRNLEWNGIQRATTVLAFFVTAAAAVVG